MMTEQEMRARGPCECLDCGKTFPNVLVWRDHVDSGKCRPLTADMTCVEMEAAYQRALGRTG